MTTDLLDLARSLGLDSKKTSSSKGGEYHSPCPCCGGKDRFIIWPTSNRYWCRQCEKHGDAIQFCRDFLELSFKDACKKLGQELKPRSPQRPLLPHQFQPVQSELPSDQWRRRSLQFVERCHEILLVNPTALETLQKRRLTLKTAEHFKIGYNSTNFWDEDSLWGLTDERSDRKSKKQWFPAGLVIPSYPIGGGLPCKLKVRRSEWKENDQLPKYVELCGSRKQYGIYGAPTLPLIIVEAELDAILLHQEAGELCCPIALGGVGKRPDTEMHQLFLSSPMVLYSLDFDEAGKKAFSFWKKTYPHIIAWPSPIGKSPSEAHEQGVNIKLWVQSGIRRA